MTAGLLLAGALAAPTAKEVRATDEALVACGTRHTLLRGDAARGIECGREVIRARFAAAAARDASARVLVDRFEASSPRTHDAKVPLENVYMILEGNDPALKGSAVIVSGHYDSMGTDIMDPQLDAPGADDDGSGTTVVIAAAGALSGRPHRATIVLAALAGEEQGLLGGKRLLEWAKEQGYAVGALLNNDIVGATNGASDARVRVFCTGDAGSPSRQLGLRLEEMLGRDRVRLVFRDDRFGRGGDHLPFLAEKLPAVRFTEPREDYRHQHQTPRVEGEVEYGDLPKFMDFAFLARVAAGNAEAAWHLANAPAPPGAGTAEGAVKPDTTVTFEAGEDPERTGFEILFRDTTEPRWTVARTVPAPGTYVLAGTRIDDVALAVRSVGRNGERSIAVALEPVVRKPAGGPPPAK
jgi:hypothetical protein